MANFRAITIQSGVLDGINDNQGLIVGNGVATNTGDLGLFPSSGRVDVTSILNLPLVANASPTIGDVWNDSTRKSEVFYSGINQVVPGVLLSTSSTKVNVNTNVETTLLGTTVGGTTLPANFFVAGKILWYRAWGVMSTAASSAGNLTLKFKLGSTSVSATAATNVTTSMASRRWTFEGYVVCQSVGAAGAFVGNGSFSFQTAAAIAPVHWEAVTSTTANTTGTLVMDLTSTWSVASASNTISCHSAIVSVLN